MENYYKILNLDINSEYKALKKELNTMQKKWIGKQNAPDLNRRQEAERFLNIIQKAEQILLDESKRQEYNELLLKEEIEGLVNDISADEESEELIAQAWDLIGEKYYADAIEIAKKATVVDDNNPNAWKTLGHTYYMCNDYELAIECYQKAVYIDSDNSEYYFDLSNIYLNNPYMIDEDKLTNAKEMTMKALWINPRENSYQLQGAVIDKMLKDFDKAISTLENLLLIDNDNLSYRSELAATYFEKAKTFLYFNEYDGLSSIINKEDGEKALNCFRKSLLYAEFPEDIARVKEWINIVHQSFEKKFDNPGFTAFVIPMLVLLIGLISTTIWLILVSIVLIAWIIYVNYVPQWKINKVLFRQ